ncbi:MAG TPA: sugar phosphate isomerase/epimerase family protein [bacterium]|nr:sugar phosphate isomerase/epimerase family protein [bacterium]
MMPRLGIIQGRLSPPVGEYFQIFPAASWREEFARARELGLDYIEWVLDAVTLNETPLLTKTGREEIRRVMDATGTRIWAVCGDYFRDVPLIRVTGNELETRLDYLKDVIGYCAELEIPSVMIPFVDHAAMANEEEIGQAQSALRAVLPFAEEWGVAVTLETALDASRYKQFMEEIHHPALRVTYDIGDCASLGHDLREDIFLLRDWIHTVHVKDRVRDGGTVAPGTGNADFDAVFAALAEIGYSGPFTLQCARETPGEEIQTTRKNIAFVKHYLTRYGFHHEIG